MYLTEGYLLSTCTPGECVRENKYLIECKGRQAWKKILDEGVRDKNGWNTPKVNFFDIFDDDCRKIR